jgi:phosphohistidine phosphatase SixA
MIDHADLWLLRHGAAQEPDAEHSDAEDYIRPLTPLGVRQAINAGHALARLAKVDKVYTSPRVRTVQTTVLACGLDFKRDRGLDHGKVAAPLEHAHDGRVTLVVGHHLLADAIAKVTGKTVELPIGGLARVAIRNGQATLRHLLSPEDIARLIR